MCGPVPMPFADRTPMFLQVLPAHSIDRMCIRIVAPAEDACLWEVIGGGGLGASGRRFLPATFFSRWRLRPCIATILLL